MPVILFWCLLIAWYVPKGIGEQIKDDFGSWTKDKVGSARNRWSDKKTAVRSAKPAGAKAKFKNLSARGGLLALDLIWSIGRSIKQGAKRGWRAGKARWAEVKEKRNNKNRNGKKRTKKWWRPKSKGKHAADRDDHADCVGPDGCGSECPKRVYMWACNRCGAFGGDYPTSEAAQAACAQHPCETPKTVHPEPTEEEMVELAEQIRRAGGGNVTTPGQVDVEASSLTTQRQSWESFQADSAADLEAAQAEAKRQQDAATAAINYAEGLAGQGMGPESVGPATEMAQHRQKQADAAAAAAAAAEASYAASQAGLQEHAIHEGINDARQGRQLANASVYNS